MSPYLIVAAALALVCGFNPFLHQLNKNPVRYFVQWLIGAIPIFVIGLLTAYLGTPALVGPFWGFTTLCIVFWGVNVLYCFVCGEIEDSRNLNSVPVPIAGIVVVCAGLCLFGIRGCTGSVLFNASKYVALVGEVEPREWAKDIKPVDASHMRMVSQKQAKWKADKKLGESPGALGSRFKVGDGAIQEVRGELVWVFPLEFIGFAKWQSFGTTDGFVMVSAEDWRKEAELITGKKQRYMMSAFFSDNAQRHLYESGYWDEYLVDFTFEVDDDLNPMLVVTRTEPTIGYWGEKVRGIVVLDTQTGVITPYGAEDEIPVWIDRVYPEYICSDYLEWWGEYHKGWLNSIWAKEGNTVPTSYPELGEGISSKHACLVFGEDGSKNWYTGMTSVSSTDEALTGFVLMNSRTGKANIYSVSGTNEKGVVDVVNSAVSNFPGFQATSPIPYNIDGNFSFVVPVSNQDNIFQRLAIVNGDGTVVEFGEDKLSILRAYRQRLSANPNMVAPGSQTTLKELTLKLSRVTPDVQNGTTVYYLFSNQYPNKVLTGTSSLSAELPLALTGDEVKIGFMETPEEVVSLRSFDIVAIELRKSVPQVAIEQRYEQTEEERVERVDAKDALKKLGDMPESDLLELLRQGKVLEKLEEKKE
ncbi:MAG: hypothetical protein ABIH58_04695 [Patescibacteria group bacterium]